LKNETPTEGNGAGKVAQKGDGVKGTAQVGNHLFLEVVPAWANPLEVLGTARERGTFLKSGGVEGDNRFLLDCTPHWKKGISAEKPFLLHTQEGGVGC